MLLLFLQNLPDELLVVQKELQELQESIMDQPFAGVRKDTKSTNATEKSTKAVKYQSISPSHINIYVTYYKI